MKPVLVLLALALTAPAAAQGTIQGTVTDRAGAVLPGVEVMTSGAPGRQKRVTNEAGRYEFTGLPAGTYTVTAALAGFVTAKREGVTVADRDTVALDFALCLGGLAEIDWVLPLDLKDAWRQSDVVAHVRIVATRPIERECPTSAVVHTATVIEWLNGNVPGSSRSISFGQSIWSGEPTPYPVGRELVVLLKATADGLWPVAGPYYTFFIDGDEVSSFHSPVKTDDLTPAQLLARLRALAKAAK